ncbi:related to type-III integral membrane protein, involved in copper and iron homeostasis [Cephalotrichum gorgonifer]|uniref:Related to type-III integral membrane protein, involved in copper and iron homeostasis n=1 Tax=Cephalotrichum gorgonifer TaxID=2041049 RepID=A0AAE8SRY2_9PEZI|nr:related to type-III integral membrane protein, involved in copper and iron homeostasis [Cephalotrichum gorgonifer]
MPRQNGAAAARPLRLVLAASTFYTLALAHGDHGDKIEEGHAISSDPIDSILWIHILLQVLAFGILYPVGMVFGMAKSRWHVPVQVLATAVTILGYFLGHMHRGRQFRHNNAHARFATPLFFILAAQVAMGIYLKLHLERGINGRIRRVVRPAHGILGKLFPVLSWAQMVFGGITALGFCQGEHVGQCATHFIMGSAFIGYGIALTIVLIAGQVWVRNSGRSQEFYESALIAAGGCLTTFTGLRWGEDWRKNDWQHAALGVVCWCAGLAGIWLSRDRDGAPKRNFVPGFVLVLTGWAMSADPQALDASTEIHKIFGYTLMASGVSRIVEIAFVLRDSTSVSEDGRRVNSFQYIPVFLLYAAGFLFMGSSEEQMVLVAGSSMVPVSYILILYSLAFLVFLFANMLIYIYGHNVPEDRKEDQQVQDAEEFELDGLVSDDEEGDSARLLKEQWVATPSTLVGGTSDAGEAR